MVWSGSSPLSVVRRSMWGFLLFAGAAWLAIGWSVLRLEPVDVVRVAGPVVLFGALTEAVRALAGTRTWWLNAGLAVLFTATGVILLLDRDSSFTTPAALLGWYLLVRGACDVAVAMMTRETDRIWGLLLVTGVVQAGLGFFAAAPVARTGDLVVLVLGGLGVVRGVADLVAALRLREVSAFRAEILDLPPERAAGVAGYSAGLTDFEAAPPRTGPKHRAATRPAAGPAAEIGDAAAEIGGPAAQAGGPAAQIGGPAAQAGGPAAEIGGPAAQAAGPGGRAAGHTTGSTAGPAPEGGQAESRAAIWATPAPGPAGAADAPAGGSFHDEVLRTTADLDAMLTLAGVTGPAVSRHPDEHDVPPVPDTPEGVETSGPAPLPAPGQADSPRR